MTSLELRACLHCRCCVIVRQIEDLQAKIALKISLLQLLHGFIQLEGNLSGPRAGLWVDREQVSQQFWRMEVSTACQAAGSEACQSHLVRP